MGSGVGEGWGSRGLDKSLKIGSLINVSENLFLFNAFKIFTKFALIVYSPPGPSIRGRLLFDYNRKRG